MTERIYGQTVIPGDQTTITGGGTIAVSAAFARDAGIVAAMDTDDGTATPGEVETFGSQSSAQSLFGEESELFEAAKLAIRNGAREIHAVAVEETDITDEAHTATDSGTLEEDDIIDPLVSPAHDIAAEKDGLSIDVELTYDVETPSENDVVNVNPVTGEFAAAESADYTFSYTVGDYESAIDAVIEETPRAIAVHSENESLGDYLATELEAAAENFDFVTVGAIGATPELDTGTYEHTIDEPRIAVVASSRGYIDADETEMVRTASAVAGRIAARSLGQSTTYDSLQGLTALHDDFTPTQAGELTDERVLTLMHDGRIFIVRDTTTSGDPRFERVYSNEIVDEATELSHLVSQNYIGEHNNDDNRSDLRASHQTFLREMRNDQLLDGFALDLEAGADDITIELGLDPVGVIDTIKVSIVVGDVITNGGVN